MKACPSCNEPTTKSKLGHCNDCEEIICTVCQDEHFKEHCDPSGISNEEYEELEDADNL